MPGIRAFRSLNRHGILHCKSTPPATRNLSTRRVATATIHGPLRDVDFVITDPDTSRILCAIELDDRTHQLPDRIERGSFVNQLFESQGLPLLRIPCAQRYEPHSLLQSLGELIGKPLAA